MGRWADDQKRKMEALQDNLRADAEPLEKYTHIGEVGGRRLDGYKKAGGRADYTMDIQLPGMLYMRFLDSPYPHAKILRMDTSRAEKLPGVRYVLRYDNPELPDMPAWERWPGFYGDPPPLSGVAHFEGEPVGAAVAADTEAIAEEALDLIVVEWEQRPFNLDVDKAKQSGAALSYPEMYLGRELLEQPACGHRHSGGREEGVCRGGQGHRVPVRAQRDTPGSDRNVRAGSSNGMATCPEVWLKQQRPHLVKKNLSSWFGGMPMNKIELHCLYQGASFGGWVQVHWNMGPLYCAGFVARKTGRPVKYVFTRREDFYGQSMDSGKYRYKVGFKKDGTITAVEAVSTIANQQWPVFNPVLHLQDNTRIPHLHGQKQVRLAQPGTGRSRHAARCSPPPSADHGHQPRRGRVRAGPVEVAFKNDGYEGHDTSKLDEEKKAARLPDHRQPEGVRREGQGGDQLGPQVACARRQKAAQRPDARPGLHVDPRVGRLAGHGRDCHPHRAQRRHRLDPGHGLRQRGGCGEHLLPGSPPTSWACAWKTCTTIRRSTRASSACRRTPRPICRSTAGPCVTRRGY